MNVWLAHCAAGHFDQRAIIGIVIQILRPSGNGGRQEGGRPMRTSHSDALVVYGVTGDLAHKMIFPALYAMVKRGTLNVPVIGVAFPKWTLERLQRRVTHSIKRSGGIDDKRAFQRLLSLLKYVSGDYNECYFRGDQGMRWGKRAGPHITLPSRLRSLQP
jgi:hypothetical protein